MPHLSSRQLEAVLAVAEYRSFVAAASHLQMSQPAITRTIKQVEAELGVTLFLRSTRHVTVTDSGKAFAAHAERLLNDLKIGIESLRERAGQPRGQVLVTSVLSLANAVLPSLIADYSRIFPGIEIHLREGLHGTVKDDVRAGVADFGVGYVDDVPTSFVTEKVGVETYYAIMPAKNPLAAKRSIELKALSGIPFVSFPPESRTRRTVDRATASAGLSLRYLMTTNRLATLHGLVRNGVGIAIVPASERPASTDTSIVSRPLVGKTIASEIGLMRLRERELSPAAEQLLGVVRTWLLTLRSRRPLRADLTRRPAWKNHAASGG